MKKESMDFLMRVSIILGAVHLILAHLWKAMGILPKLVFRIGSAPPFLVWTPKVSWAHIAFVSEIGWSVWFIGMFGVVQMFLLKGPFEMYEFPYYPWWLIMGGGLAILFAAPGRNPLKMIGLGLANFPLAAIGTFGDTLSYIRLMAIGLAGSQLAFTFNDITKGLPWPATVLLLILAHGLNVALTIIALLAHGVRLNMLEFSNNLGMQWSGYPYEPFAKSRNQEA
jgi:V/A-type H+-transporting ATPase subunit I